MSRTNDYKLHIHILPEDPANRELANGFELETSPIYGAMQVLSETNGWSKLLEIFESNHVPRLRANQNRMMVLLVDFDKDKNRLSRVRKSIPADLMDRVFVLGCWDEPERLRRDFGPSYESIGRRLAEDCRQGTKTIWNHELLHHNSDELERLVERVKPILFP